MKILIVITRGDSIGGAQTHVLALADNFRASGNDVLICYGGQIEGPFNKLLLKSGLNYVTIPTLGREISIVNDVKSIGLLRRIISNFSPDVISLHSSKAGIIGRISAMFSNIPVVFTVHGWAFTEGVKKINSLLYKNIERNLAKYADEIIVVSEYDKKIASFNRISKETKITVVHNGISVIEKRQSIDRSDDSIVHIVMIARFDSQKDHETLVLACREVDNVKIHLLGDGPNMKAIVDLVENYGLSNKFLFHGYSEKVNEVLNFSDIFVLISNWEGFPISTLEAMGYALPVIISDVGGAKEAIVENETGFSIGRKDVTGLIEKLNLLVSNPSLRRTMGQKGREILENNFSCDMMCKKTLDIYQKAIMKKKR